MASAWWKRKLAPKRLEALWDQTFGVLHYAALELGWRLNSGAMTPKEVRGHEEAFRQLVSTMPPCLQRMLAASLLIGAAAEKGH